MATITIKGLAELQVTLETLPRKVVTKVLREPMTDAANLVKDAMIQLAPKETGFLADHFNAKYRVVRNEIAGSAFIGPAGKMYYPNRGSKERGTATGKHPHKGGVVPVASVARFLEFGTSKRPAKPFMRQAFEMTKDEALARITEGLKEALASVGKQ